MIRSTRFNTTLLSTALLSPLSSMAMLGCRPLSFHKHFSWQSCLQVQAKKKIPTTPLYKVPTAAQKNHFPVPISTQYYSYTESLSRRSSPLLLYQAPSHTAYIASSFALGTFCFSYAIINFHSNYLNAPQNIPQWAPLAFGTVCFMMVGFGTWLILGPTRYES